VLSVMSLPWVKLPAHLIDLMSVWSIVMSDQIPDQNLWDRRIVK
jgi:hypothetical protein